MLVKTKKYIAFFLLFFTIGGFVVGAMPQPAKAQWITADIPSLSGWIGDKLSKSWDKITKQMLATAFKQSLSTFLKKLAYDSAVYVASAGSGQKSLVNPFKGNYLLDLAEGATGEFIDELAQKSGFASALGTTSLCEPVDLTMKANLLMSFKKPKEPPAPKCSLTKIAQAAQKSANDNLLEFNAGFEESEGGLNIILSGVNAEQNFAGTKAQLELSRISDELTPLLADLQEIMSGIAEASIGGGMGPEVQRDLIGVSAQEFADSQLDRLHSIEDKLGEYDGTLFTLQENAGKCLGEYSKYGSVCGNGAVSTGEECDVSGPLCITPTSCKITPAACDPAGTPGTLDPAERCDGVDLDGKTCKDLGFANGGTLKCTVNCNFDTDGCFEMQSAECNNAELVPSCADFYTAASLTMCNKNASFAIQYVGTILGTVSSYLTQVQEWNAKIESKAFDEVGATDPNDIANAFNPEANEMGQFGKIQEALSEKTQAQLEHEKLKTLAEGPCKGVTKPISGEVVTPSAATCAAINQALEKSTKGQETFTGTIADAFGVFVNTLTSKLMERYFKQGLSMVFDRKGLKDCKGGKDICGDKTEDILRSGASLGGKAAAEKALGGLLTASIETGGQQDILSILAACPPEQPALNNCIIDEPFRRAIERQYTVKEAMEAYKKSGGSEGLDPKKPFGYILVGTAMDEPDFKNGYPYRSMLYLRKYRIIPVGWELASQYIKDIEATKQVHTLDNVVDGFDDPTSPFFGLADPAWVLKSPTVFCARQGPGPELLSTELMCEKIASGATGGQCESDDYQARKVSRKTWCADEQTCLEEGENGDCKRYGYCTLEKPSWKLGGTQCDKPFASCEGYTNSITKANYTLLENTLNKSDCSQSNVGCLWYCQDAPKMCVGGTRGGQPCDINNDCASIYCSVGKCVSSGIACSYDNDCGSGATGFCSNNNATSCTTATVGTDCGAGNQCILCNTGARACVNGDTPGAACANNAQCGRGVVDGVCEEGGVWSCLNTGTCSNSPFTSCTKATEITACGAGNVCNLTGDRVNLDRDVKKCEAKDAGCNQFIKVLPGTNLIGNSGFEDDADLSPPLLTIATGTSGYVNKWYLYNDSGANLEASIDNTRVHSGKNSLYIKMNPGPSDLTQGLWMDDSASSYSVVPSGFLFDSEKSYTISAWVYIDDAATGKISLTAGSPFLPPATTTQTSSQWERISLTIPAGTPINEIRIFPSAGPLLTRFYIDDLQLEESDTTSNYVQYGSSNQAYLNGRRLSCLKQEVGCNLYTPSEGGDPIPAVVKTKDQCPAECAGYASFQELPTFFAPSGSLFENLIPKTASSCPASAEGCEEFTNLDTVASGGEAKEYYTKLRQCAKPGTTTEATFYTWEGSEEAGFQLRAWRFKTDTSVPPRPATTDSIPGCDLDNPDCRTFYDQNGNTFMEELSSTVFISNDCHPLRKTIEGSEDDCTDSGGYLWEDPDGDLFGTCFYNAIPSQGLKCTAKYAGCREYRGAAGNNLRVLLNDDFEDLTSQGWTPSSLSNESITVGGRSYTMAASASATKSVAGLITQGKTYVLDYWAKSATGIGTTVSAELFGTDPLVTTILVFPGADPVTSEWNKYSVGPLVFNREPANDETIRLTNGADGLYIDNIVLREITDNPYLIKDSWKTPLSCDLDPSDPTAVIDDLVSNITALGVIVPLNNVDGFLPSGTVIIDGEAIQYGGVDLPSATLIDLTRGIRGTTPASHIAGVNNVWKLDEGAQLGCKEYTDRLNQKTYLRSFDYLCGEDKVGCTEMFNTYNSRSMYEQTIKGEYIPRDAVEYIVDNPKVYCNASFKGCEKLGQPALGPDQSISSWGETYLINDPDQYDQIACESNENMCSEFITRGGGTMYFKDSKDALCEYQSSINIEGVITKGWFKKGVIPAALGGLVFYDSDGVDGPDTYAHLECVNASGGWDETKWTYSCPNDQVGCTEYQTPAVSTRQTGSQYISAVGLTGFTPTIDGATTVNPGNAIWQYRFDILESGNYNLALSTENYNSGTNEPFTIAVIRHHLRIYIDGVLKKTLNDASSPLAPQAISAAAQTTAIDLSNLERGKRIIAIEWFNEWCDGGGCPISDSNLRINSLNLSKSAGNNYYNLEQGVDTSSCTGVVDPEKGCVAFYDATNPILNIKSSAVSGNAFAPAACQKCSLDATSCSTLTTCKPDSENCCCTNNAAVTNPCDSNTILKVKADRQCAEWLACTESEKTTDSKGNIIEMCKKRQACYKTGDGVECASDGLVSEIKQNQTFDNPVATDVPPHAGVIADANLRSGYFKAGAHWSRVCSNNSDLSCQVDSDCGAGNACDNQITSVANTIEGYYPYGQMTQGWCSNNAAQSCVVDSDCGAGKCLPNVIAFEDDFETYQAGKGLPQCSTNAGTVCTDDTQCKPPPLGTNIKDEGTCLNYWPTGSAKSTNKEFKFGGQSLLIAEPTNVGAGSAVASKLIPVTINATYALTVWINTKNLEPGPGPALPLLRIDINGNGTVVEQRGLEDWTKFIVQFTPTVSPINISIYLFDNGGGIKAGSKAYVDMISLAPVLEIQSPTGSESYSDRSCRIYAKPDALACKYRERNTGREIQGWRGFCAEADPKNPEYCLQWWPIDLISGEDISKF